MTSIKVESGAWWENNHTKHGVFDRIIRAPESKGRSVQAVVSRVLQHSDGEPIQGRLRLGTSMTIGPSADKSEPPGDGQQRDNVLSRIHQCLSFPFFDVAMLVFHCRRETTKPRVA